MSVKTPYFWKATAKQQRREMQEAYMLNALKHVRRFYANAKNLSNDEQEILDRVSFAINISERT